MKKDKEPLKKLKNIPIVLSLDEFKETILRSQDRRPDAARLFQSKIDHIPFFAPGRYMWYLVDKLTISAMGGMTRHFTGQEAEEWIGRQPEDYFSLIHPKDIPAVMTYAKVIYEFLQENPEKKGYLHPNIYFRLKPPQAKDYQCMLFQYIDWEYGADGGIACILHALYDITHLNPETPCKMSILDNSKKEDQLFISLSPEEAMQQPVAHISISHFTQREREILRLLSQGLASKQMAEILSIAKNTVENHRQRLLKKTNCKSSAELIAYSLRLGIL